MLDIIDALHAEAGMTIIMVTHDAESVAKRADRVIAMDRGAIVSDGSLAEAFVDIFEKKQTDMTGLPVALKLIIRLSLLGMEIPYYTVNMDECVELIKDSLKDR
jgi:energy-coupling factor transporter ATP-binding protein EcfA2